MTPFNWSLGSKTEDLKKEKNVMYYLQINASNKQEIEGPAGETGNVSGFLEATSLKQLEESERGVICLSKTP